jgi:hypothetical protein
VKQSGTNYDTAWSLEWSAAVEALDRRRGKRGATSSAGGYAMLLGDDSGATQTGTLGRGCGWEQTAGVTLGPVVERDGNAAGRNLFALQVSSLVPGDIRLRRLLAEQSERARSTPRFNGHFATSLSAPNMVTTTRRRHGEQVQRAEIHVRRHERMGDAAGVTNQ